MIHVPNHHVWILVVSLVDFKGIFVVYNISIYYLSNESMKSFFPNPFPGFSRPLAVGSGEAVRLRSSSAAA